MTERQSEALRAIQEFKDEHGYAPSFRQLGGILGLESSGSVHYLVQTLKEMGLLNSEPNQPRTLNTLNVPSYVPELVIEYEGIPGIYTVMDDNFAGPPGKQRYATFPTREEAAAYRQGWFDGFSGE